MMTGLILRNVQIAFKGHVLVSLSATVAPGEVLTVMGPSGAGKSTLLSYIIGNISASFSTFGQVLLDGVDVTSLPSEERRIGILFQDDLLFPHMSVGENLAFGLSAGGTKEERKAKILAALAEVDLAGFFDRDPATLSGGQKARVALMRMLLSKPCALLLDEPFSRLDTQLREQVRRFVFEQARRRQLPVLMVTHDASDAEAADGRVLSLAATAQR